MTSLEDALRDLLRAVVRDVLREEVRAAVEELRKASAPSASTTPSLRYLSAREAAEVTGVHPQTIRGWLQTNRLPCYRIGRLTRVRLDELQTFVEQHVPERAEVNLDEMANALLIRTTERDRTRCARCRHLPSMHDAGGRCRARNCACSAFEYRPGG